MVPSPGPRSPVKTLNGFNKMYEAASLKNNRNSLDVSSLKTVRKVKEEPEEEAFNWRENLIKMREQIKAVNELPKIEVRVEHCRGVRLTLRHCDRWAGTEDLLRVGSLYC